MYEYHGWVTIREATYDIDEDNEDIIIEKLQSKISSLQWVNGILKLIVVNGDCQVVVSGLTNHKRQEAYELFELYEYIAKIAPGSYGLLHIFDDEDLANNNENKFQVFVLARGKITQHEDQYLSPIIPTIEDEY